MKTYKKHVILYGALPEKQDVLDRFDTLIVGEGAWETLNPKYLPKTLLYVDIWAHANYKDTPAWAWQKRPKEEGQSSHPLEWAPGRTTYAYNWTDRAHLIRFERWLEAVKQKNVLGVFLDDWAADRFWWDGDENIKKTIWPGYPSNSYLWPQIQQAERLARAIFPQTIVNGPGRKVAYRMAENVSKGKETWRALEVIGADPARYFQTGDFLQLNVFDAKGIPPISAIPKIEHGVRLVKLRGGSLGMAYSESPGGSIYQLVQSPWGDPRNWPK